MNNSVADISSCTVSDVYQLDGNVTFLDDSQIRQAEAELEPNSANLSILSTEHWSDYYDLDMSPFSGDPSEPPQYPPDPSTDL